MDLIVATSSFLPSPGVAAWGTVHGETAHAALGLAKGLRALGHRTTLVAPLTAEAQQSGIGLARRLSPIVFDVSGTAHQRIVFDARLPSGVELVLLGGEVPTESEDPQEIARRWTWFGHAVAAFARQRLGLVRQPGEGELEAVIAVGEPAGFTALAIREGAHATPDGGPSPRLLAGLARLFVPIAPAMDMRMPRAAMSSIGVAPELFSPEGIEFYGEISLAKAGAIAADRVVALGESARAALTKEGAAHRFDGVYRARGGDVLSVSSGVDQAQYSPATDPHLVARYDPEDMVGKARGRSSLLTELELDPGASLPLMAVLGPVAPAAESALAAALDRALRGELLLAVARTASRAGSHFDVALDRLAKTHPGRVTIRYGAPDSLLHRILASSDFVLIADEVSATATPARAALRYGTIPVALRTPATFEAIVELEASLATGTGILFAEPTADDAFGAIQRAVSAHATRGFAKVQRRAMRLEGGWERAARRLEGVVAALEA